MVNLEDLIRDLREVLDDLMVAYFKGYPDQAAGHLEIAEGLLARIGRIVRDEL